MDRIWCEIGGGGGGWLGNVTPKCMGKGVGGAKFIHFGAVYCAEWSGLGGIGKILSDVAANGVGSRM